MEQSRREELERKLRQALREHQHEGLHMIGGVDQLIERLVLAVEQWESGATLRKQKSA